MTEATIEAPVVKNLTTRAEIVSDVDLDRLDAIAASSGPAARYARMAAAMVREEVLRGRPAAKTILEAAKAAKDVDAKLDSDDESDVEEVNAYRKLNGALQRLEAKRQEAIDAAAAEWDAANGKKLESGQESVKAARKLAHEKLSGAMVDESVQATYKDVLEFVNDSVKQINARLPEGTEPIKVQGGAKVGGKAVATAKGDGWRPKLSLLTVDGADVKDEGSNGKITRTFTVLARVVGGTAAEAQEAFTTAAGSREEFQKGETFTVDYRGHKVSAAFKS